VKVTCRSIPTDVPDSIARRIKRDVTKALKSITTRGKRFIVNDTPCFMKRGGRSQKVTPCVMNAADFLSKRFQTTLHDSCKWEREYELRGQTIDNFVSLPLNTARFRIPADRFPEFFATFSKQNRIDDLRSAFLEAWHRFVRVGIDGLDSYSAYREFFGQSEASTSLRIGLEFETGNIASAFRALDKLETLFVVGEIDCGVFVTSIDKPNAAARIWPQSNRNGSFQELENRNYRHNRTVPLWEFGFAPDAFERDAPFLASDGSLYPLAPTAGKVESHGVTYDVFLRYGHEEILIPRGTHQLG
jgi:hypothetical protein